MAQVKMSKLYQQYFTKDRYWNNFTEWLKSDYRPDHVAINASAILHALENEEQNNNGTFKKILVDEEMISKGEQQQEDDDKNDNQNKNYKNKTKKKRA